jgi:hypothetical protein
MATLTLAQIKQYNPNWAGRNKTPGKQFSIRSTDNKYWNFTYQSGEGDGAVYTFEKSDKPFSPPPDMTDEQMTKEIAAGTYGEGEDRSLALAQSIWAQGTDRGKQVQQAVNTMYADPAALATLGSGPGPGTQTTAGGSTVTPATTQQPAAATRQRPEPLPVALQFDPNNPRLQQYIQRIVYGKNLQGFYSERNVKKAYQELVARRYTPEQALAAIEAFNKSFSSSNGGSYGMDRNMRAAMQSRNQTLAGENADLRVASAARNLTAGQETPVQEPVDKNAVFAEQFPGITIKSDSGNGDIVGSDDQHYRWYPQHNKWGPVAAAAPSSPPPAAAAPKDPKVPDQGITGNGAIPTAGELPVPPVGQETSSPASSVEPPTATGQVPAASPELPGAQRVAQRVAYLQQMSSGVPGLQVLGPADPTSGAFKVTINGKPGVGYVFGTKPYFVTMGPNGTQVQGSDGVLLNHSSSPGAQNGGPKAPADVERFLADKDVTTYSSGGYVARPKRSIVTALQQWKFGT